MVSLLLDVIFPRSLFPAMVNLSLSRQSFFSLAFSSRSDRRLPRKSSVSYGLHFSYGSRVSLLPGALRTFICFRSFTAPMSVRRLPSI